MRAYIEIKEPDDAIVIRWEDEISGEGDLPWMFMKAMGLFHAEFPNRSLFIEDGGSEPPLTVSWGLVHA